MRKVRTHLIEQAKFLSYELAFDYHPDHIPATLHSVLRTADCGKLCTECLWTKFSSILIR